MIPIRSLGGCTEEAKRPLAVGAVSLGWSPGPQPRIRHWRARRAMAWSRAHAGGRVQWGESDSVT